MLGKLLGLTCIGVFESTVWMLLELENSIALRKMVLLQIT